MTIRQAAYAGLFALPFIACATVPEPVTVYCDEFQVGADFGQDGGPAPTYAALAQAVSDVTVLASTLLRSVDAACVDLTVAFGGNPEASRLAEGSAAARVRSHCERAAARILASGNVLRAANVKVWFARQSCLADTGYQLACEATCRADASCVEVDSRERCGDGDVVGTCNGVCAGACDGSAGSPVACDGACNGACDGACSGAGRPVGTFVSGGRCYARCLGQCGGTCAPHGGASVCEGACRGPCEGTTIALRCTAPLEAPQCIGDIDCQRACRASAHARATCPAVALGVTSDPARTPDSTSRLIRALERDLPTVFLVARGRGDEVRDASRDLGGSTRHFAASDDTNAERAACAITIARTGAIADENMRATSKAAKTLSDALDSATKP